MFRDEARGIARNTLVMLFQQVLTIGSAALLMLFLPRYLGPARYGYIFLAISISQIFYIVASYGGNYIITKKVARSPADTARIVLDASVLRFAISAISVAAMIIMAEVADYPYEERVVLVLYAISLFWVGGSTALRAAYQGHEVMHFTSAGAVAERLFAVVTVIPAIWLGADVIMIAVLIVIGSLLNFLFLLYFAGRIMGKLPRIRWTSFVEELKEGLPYFLLTALGVIYYRINAVMLSKMAAEDAVGWYGGAFRLFEMLNFPTILTAAIYPVLSRLWKNEERTHQRTMQKTLEIVFVGGVFISVAAIMFAENIVGMFYGLSEYGPSVLPLQILCAGLIFLYVDMIIGATLLSCDKQKELTLVSLAAIPVSVILSWILIPYFETQNQNGGIGAAIATGTTEMFIMISFLSLLPSGMLGGLRKSVFVKGLMAGGGMVLFLWAGTLIDVPWILKGVLSAVVFFGLLLFLKAFEPAEQELLKGLFTAKGFKSMLQYLKASVSGSGSPPAEALNGVPTELPKSGQ
jgi:O-antigen/teichoic acid export membrane protein